MEVPLGLVVRFIIFLCWEIIAAFYDMLIQALQAL